MFWNIQLTYLHPLESVVEGMGNVIEKICEAHGGSKASTNKKDCKDTSDKLIVFWNGPNISKCDRVVMPGP